MITISGIRDAFWCAVAFIIVACATAPIPVNEAGASHAKVPVSQAPAESVRT